MPLTDLILASKDEAQKIADSDYPLESWAGIDTKGIDVVAYSNLYSILTEQEWQPDILDQFPLVSQGTEEGPWVSIFPAEMTEMLAGLEGDKMEKIAEDWSQAEEMAYFDPKEIKELLGEMRNLAKRAGSDRSDLLIWMSL
ncbi:MAG: hypothetical protein R2747_12905 [Pyrinomonadaceae bacterium]